MELERKTAGEKIKTWNRDWSQTSRKQEEIWKGEREDDYMKDIQAQRECRMLLLRRPLILLKIPVCAVSVTEQIIYV